MRKTLFILIFTVSINAETYVNSRFNFSIDYPAEIFIKKSYPANGDGIWLNNKDETVTLIPNGHLAVIAKNIQEAYHQSIKWKNLHKAIEITYKVQKQNWFVISGYNHEKKTIFYEKKFYDNEKIMGYIFSYPIKFKKKYGKYIKTFNKSFSY